MYTSISLVSPSPSSEYLDPKYSLSKSIPSPAVFPCSLAASYDNLKLKHRSSDSKTLTLVILNSNTGRVKLQQSSSFMDVSGLN